MDDNKRRWLYSRDNLLTTIRLLGFPDELSEAIVKNLGSLKAMDRMTSYRESDESDKCVMRYLKFIEIYTAWEEQKD